MIGGKFSPSRASARAVRCEKRPMRRKPDGLVGSVTFAPIFLKSGYSTISTACLVETQRYTSGSVPRSWPSDARARGRLVTQSNHPDGRLREPRRSAPRRSAAGTRSGGPRREPVGVEAASRSRLRRGKHADLPASRHCQPRTLLAIYPCQGTPEGAILASNHREFEECRINGRLSEAEAVIRLD